MNTPSRQRKKLPVKPSLEHLQKQAKRLVKTTTALTLAKAQHQLAEEYGCKNWAELTHVVETMLRGADQLVGVKRKSEPLSEAAREMDFEQVRSILGKGDFTLHDLDQALAHAVWYGDESTWSQRKSIADLLLEHGADPNGQYGSGYGPLVFGTCECLQPVSLQYLIDAGADVAFPPIDTKYGKSCPFSHLGTYVRGRNQRKHQMIDILLRHNAYVPPEVTPPILAIHRGDAKSLGELLDRDKGLLTQCFPNMPFGNIELRGATLLHCAVEFGEIECIEELLKRYADINTKADIIDGIGGQTPIFHAINTNGDNNFYTLEYLVKRVGQYIDMSVRATWRSFGEVQPRPMTPLEYAEHAVKTGDPQWRKKIAEELAILR
ncbi:MAG: ankyrin repeat domain-containing protein, partial [Chthoniobacterales bacterium]